MDMKLRADAKPSANRSHGLHDIAKASAATRLPTPVRPPVGKETRPWRRQNGSSVFGPMTANEMPGACARPQPYPVSQAVFTSGMKHATLSSLGSMADQRDPFASYHASAESQADSQATGGPGRYNLQLKFRQNGTKANDEDARLWPKMLHRSCFGQQKTQILSDHHLPCCSSTFFVYPVVDGRAVTVACPVGILLFVIVINHTTSLQVHACVHAYIHKFIQYKHYKPQNST